MAEANPDDPQAPQECPTPSLEESNLLTGNRSGTAGSPFAPEARIGATPNHLREGLGHRGHQGGTRRWPEFTTVTAAEQRKAIQIQIVMENNFSLNLATST